MLVGSGTCLDRATIFSDLVSEETRKRSGVGKDYQWTDNRPAGCPLGAELACSNLFVIIN